MAPRASLAVAALACLRLAGTEARKAAGGFCCTAHQSEEDPCGSCWPGAVATLETWNFCGTSEQTCSTCGSVWCNGTFKPHSPLEQIQVRLLPTLSKGDDLNLTADMHFCCAASQDDSDKCGTCYPSSAKAPNDWCGKSESRCSTCGGSWCRLTHSEATPSPTHRPTPHPATQPRPQTTPRPTPRPSPPPPSPRHAPQPSPNPSPKPKPKVTTTAAAPSTAAPAPRPKLQNTTTPRPTTPPLPPPTAAPTQPPATNATEKPSAAPTSQPTAQPTGAPTAAPDMAEPTSAPTALPTALPTAAPTAAPTAQPTEAATFEPTQQPTESPDSGISVLMPEPEDGIEMDGWNCSVGRHSWPSSWSRAKWEWCCADENGIDPSLGCDSGWPWGTLGQDDVPAESDVDMHVDMQASAEPEFLGEGTPTALQEQVNIRTLDDGDIDVGFCCMVSQSSDDPCGTCWPEARAGPASKCGRSRGVCESQSDGCGKSWCNGVPQLALKFEQQTQESRSEPAGSRQSRPPMATFAGGAAGVVLLLVLATRSAALGLRNSSCARHVRLVQSVDEVGATSAPLAADGQEV